MNMEECTHDCSTCGSTCSNPDGEPKKDFFTGIDDLADNLDAEKLNELLDKAMEEDQK